MKCKVVVFISFCFLCFFLLSSNLSGANKTFANSIGMQFVLIPAGSFMMGTKSPNCPEDDPFTEKNEYRDCMNFVSEDETPIHKVNISKPFYLSKYEVTQEEWYKVMGNNPSHFKSEKVGGNSRRHPVEQVSWYDVQQFIKKLNAKEGRKYRLPTEAEWEYAARAGSSEDYCYGPNKKLLGAYAWYYNNSGDKTHPVGQKKPNKWGPYDMHGNVYEWCQDRYDKKYYAKSPGTDPQGPSTGSDRVYRGGSWNLNARYCRSVYRNYDSPNYRHGDLGFRLVFPVGQ